MAMITKGLVVRLQANRGLQRIVEGHLCSALPLVQDEPNTAGWFAHLTRRVPRGRAKHAATPVGGLPGVDMLDVTVTGLPR